MRRVWDLESAGGARCKGAGLRVERKECAAAVLGRRTYNAVLGNFGKPMTQLFATAQLRGMRRSQS